MKKALLFTIFFVTMGLILPLILVYAATEINEPNDASSRMPTIISGSGTDRVTNEAPSAQEGNIAKLIQYIYTFAMLAAGLAVIGGLIYGGVRYLFAGGSITKMFAARSQVRNALYGLGLILISYLILYTINPALVNLVNPTADPLKLKTGSIWSLNSSYGMMLNNAPVGKPCVGDYDCSYDLACCPDSSGDKRINSCRQNGGDPNQKKTSDLKTTGNPPKNEPWFQCGWVVEPSWLLVGQNGSCPNTFREANIVGDSKCKDPKNCCDKADLNGRYLPDSKKAICCQTPNLVIAKDQAECSTLYGKACDDPTTTDNVESTCNAAPVATCQPIWPLTYSENDEKSYVESWWTKKKSAINDRFGDPCQFNTEFIWNVWIGDILRINQEPRDSCLDWRLLCNSKFKKCTEPQGIDGPCTNDKAKDSDCCQSSYTWMSACDKYTSRGVSLKCAGPNEYEQTCTFKNAGDESKIDEGGESGTGGDTSGGEPDRATCTWVDGKATPPSGGHSQQTPLTGTCEVVTQFQHNINPAYGILPAQGQTGDGSCTGLSSNTSAKCCCKAKAVATSKSCQVFGTQQYATCAQNPDFKMNGNLSTDCSSSQTGVICCCRFKPATTDNGWKSAMAVNKNQFNDADPQLIGLLNCTNNIYPTSNGWQITSISISGGGSNFERCKLDYNKNDCVHAKDSCHFCSKSIAVDFQPTAGKGTKTNFNDPIYQSVISAAKTCAPKVFINNEASSANHVHLDLRDYSSCSCGA